MSVDSSTDGRQIKKLQIFHTFFCRFFRMKFADLSEKRLYQMCVIRCNFCFKKLFFCNIMLYLDNIMIYGCYYSLLCYRMQYLVHHSDKTNVYLFSPNIIKSNVHFWDFISFFCLNFNWLKQFFPFFFTEFDMHVFDILIIWFFIWKLPKITCLY